MTTARTIAFNLNSAHVPAVVNLFLERADQKLEIFEVLAGTAKVDVLILKPHALLGGTNQRKHMLNVVVRRE